MTVAAPLPTPRDHPAPGSPAGVVEAFLARLVAYDIDAALALCDDNITYVNVGLPALHGHRRVRQALTAMSRRVTAFEVYLHAIAEDDATVLTERTDVLVFGRVRQQFWVTGRFDVVDGRVVLWRDGFDYVDLMLGLLRGVAGAVVPALRPGPPQPGSAPGRH